jgi:hypothetical protein
MCHAVTTRRSRVPKPRFLDGEPESLSRATRPSSPTTIVPIGSPFRACSVRGDTCGLRVRHLDQIGGSHPQRRVVHAAVEHDVIVVREAAVDDDAVAGGAAEGRYRAELELRECTDELRLPQQGDGLSGDLWGA